MARPASLQVGGFYQTPLELIPSIAALIDTSAAYQGVFRPNPYSKSAPGETHYGTYALLDPCAGDGEALTQLAQAWFRRATDSTLLTPTATSQATNPMLRHYASSSSAASRGPVFRLYACEMEQERYHKLKSQVSQKLGYFQPPTLLHADSLTLTYTRSSTSTSGEEGVSILYLNPPYSPNSVYGRLEQHFLEKFTGTLIPGSGLLVLVVPYYALSASAAYLAQNYEAIECYRFPDPYYQAFSQVVLAARRRSGSLGLSLGSGEGEGSSRSFNSSLAFLPIEQDPVAQQILTWAADPLGSLPVLSPPALTTAASQLAPASDGGIEAAANGAVEQPSGKAVSSNSSTSKKLALPATSRAGLELETTELDLTTLLKLSPVWQMSGSVGGGGGGSKGAGSARGTATSSLTTSNLATSVRPLYVREVGADKTLAELLGRPYPSAMPPKPAHLALALSSGAFNGKQIEADDPATTGLPPLLVKGVFTREYETVSSNTDKEGRITSSVQIQQPLLEVYVLDLVNYTYHRLKSGSANGLDNESESNGETSRGGESSVTTNGHSLTVADLTLGDLLRYYGTSLTELMLTQFPPLHQPNNPAHQMTLPGMARSLYRAQHHGVQTMLKLMAQCETPIGASQPGTGKTGMSLAVAHALSLSHFRDTLAELRRLGHLNSGCDNGSTSGKSKLRPVRRVLVLCPPINVATWRGEIPLWLPGAKVVTVEGVSDLVELSAASITLSSATAVAATITLNNESEQSEAAPAFPLQLDQPTSVAPELIGEGLTFYLLSRETAKLGHAYISGAVEVSLTELSNQIVRLTNTTKSTSRASSENEVFGSEWFKTVLKHSSHSAVLLCPQCGGSVHHAPQKLASGRLSCTNNPLRPANDMARLARSMAELMVGVYPDNRDVIGLTFEKRYLNLMRQKAVFEIRESLVQLASSRAGYGQEKEWLAKLEQARWQACGREANGNPAIKADTAATNGPTPVGQHKGELAHFAGWQHLLSELVRLCVAEYRRDPKTSYNAKLTTLCESLIKVGRAAPMAALAHEDFTPSTDSLFGLTPISDYQPLSARSDPSAARVADLQAQAEIEIEIEIEIEAEADEARASSLAGQVSAVAHKGLGAEARSAVIAALLEVGRQLFEVGAEDAPPTSFSYGFSSGTGWHYTVGHKLREAGLALILVAQYFVGVNPLTLAAYVTTLANSKGKEELNSQLLEGTNQTVQSGEGFPTTAEGAGLNGLSLIEELKARFPQHPQAFEQYTLAVSKLARQYCQSWPVYQAVLSAKGLESDLARWQQESDYAKHRWGAAGWPGTVPYYVYSASGSSVQYSAARENEGLSKWLDRLHSITTRAEAEGIWSGFELDPHTASLLVEQTPAGDPALILAAFKEVLGLSRFVRSARPCGAPLYQATPQPRRYPLAKYILRYKPRFFDLFLEDEAQEYANEGTAQEKAANRLVALPGVPVIPLSGSLTNGYPGSLFSNFWQWSARFRGDFERSDRERFITRFGYRKQLVIHDADLWNRQGERTVLAYGRMSDREEQIEQVVNARQLGVAPGVLPPFILQYLLPQAVIVHKSELEADLPPITETPVLIEFDQTREDDKKLQEAARSLQTKVLERIKSDRFERDMTGKLWGALAELPSYLDLCHITTGNAYLGAVTAVQEDKGKDKVTPSAQVEIELSPSRTYRVAYPESCGGSLVATGELFPTTYLTPKERWLVSTVRTELAEGRKVIIFVRHTGVTDPASVAAPAKAPGIGTSTGKKGASPANTKAPGKAKGSAKLGLVNRLLDLCQKELGEEAVFMDSSKVSTDKRQDWLSREVVARGRRILILNPKTVKTGLNNLVAFNTAIWYELDYETITYIQANGRLHRPNQTLPVRVFFPVYRGTSQEIALTLLANKVKASLQVDGLDVASALEAVGGGTADERAESVAAAMSMGQAIYKRLIGAANYNGTRNLNNQVASF